MNQIISIDEEKMIHALIEKMSLEEKIGQMNQLSPSIVGGFDLPFEELIEMVTEGRISHDDFGKIMENAEMDFHEDQIKEGKIGSFLINDPRKANELQRIAVEESRLGIPLIFGFDVIHGFHTVYPIPLAEACSWNQDIFEESARIAAREARSHNIHWTFAPMVDIARDARWGRIAESPGEDPYLASLYADAKVKGFQGKDYKSEDNVVACLKHFVAYGAAEAGQDYNTVSMAPNILYNTYLEPFKAGIKAGAATVMGAFNDYNGVPCTVNNFLLRQILKETYEFDGFIVSDANAIDDCVRHGIAKDLEEASQKAILAGMDMDMNSHAYSKYLKKQIENGELSLELLDDAVKRILSVKMAFGLFDNPYVAQEQMDKYEEIPKEHIESALNAGKKSIVLLKNEGVLPLKKNQKIALIGELANLENEVLGSWAMAARSKDCISIYQGIKNANADVRYSKVCGVNSPFVQEELDDIEKEADIIVAVVGETASMSGEAASRADISLPGQQLNMIKAALATGKPVVVVLMNGRPMEIPWIAENVNAIVEAWQLGIQMGNAVSEVLFGDYNPSGKLCVTFPTKSGQCPTYYDHPSTGRPGGKSKFSSRYLDVPVEPLYPFGFGLSYTHFEYNDFHVEQTKTSIIAKINVSNTGHYEGEETVQVYVQDIVASIVRPVKSLKGFKKVILQPGESQQVEVIIQKKDLGFYDNEMNYRIEDGKFNIFMGTNSRDCQKVEIEITF